MNDQQREYVTYYQYHRIPVQDSYAAMATILSCSPKDMACACGDTHTTEGTVQCPSCGMHQHWSCMIDFHYAGAHVTYVCYICAPERHHYLLYNMAKKNKGNRIRLRTIISESIWRVYALRFCRERLYDEPSYAFTMSWVRALEHLCDHMPAAKVNEMVNKVEITAKTFGAQHYAVIGVLECYADYAGETYQEILKLGVIAEILQLVIKGTWSEEMENIRPEWVIKLLRDAKVLRIRKELEVKVATRKAEYEARMARAEQELREAQLRVEQRLREERFARGEIVLDY